MAEATLAQHTAARKDDDLKERFIAAAEQLGLSNQASMWVDQNQGRLVAVDIDGTSVSAVHAYAVATYQPTPRPGQNPAAVTDDQIKAAILAVKAEADEQAANNTGSIPPPMPA